MLCASASAVSTPCKASATNRAATPSATSAAGIHLPLAVHSLLTNRAPIIWQRR
jgi:hypothetical protein